MSVKKLCWRSDVENVQSLLPRPYVAVHCDISLFSPRISSGPASRFLMRTAGLQKFVAAFLAEKRRRRTFWLKTFVFYEIYG